MKLKKAKNILLKSTVHNSFQKEHTVIHKGKPLSRILLSLYSNDMILNIK